MLAKVVHQRIIDVSSRRVLLVLPVISYDMRWNILSSVIQFVNYMDQKDIKYNNRVPFGDNGREVVEVSFSGKNMNSVRTVFYFDADAEAVAIRVYDIVKVPEEKVDMIYPAINSLNKHFRFAKFVLDTDDNTIQAELDAAFRSRDVGEICYELLIRMVDICDTAYPDLMKALWA